MLRVAHLALVAALMCVAAAHLPPAFDEAYYWTWSSAPAWSYFDHPPMIAWAIAASRAVFGDGLLALRALSLTCVAIVACATVGAARALSPSREVTYLALLTLAGSMMFVIGYLPATPDVVQGAQLALAACAITRAPRSRAMVVAAAALLVGGAVVKHTSALILVGATAGLVWRRPRALASPWPWLGAALGAALVVPWLLADLDGSTAFQAARVFDGSASVSARRGCSCCG